MKRFAYEFRNVEDVEAELVAYFCEKYINSKNNSCI
jgi:hypothetical protein